MTCETPTKGQGDALPNEMNLDELCDSLSDLSGLADAMDMVLFNLSEKRPRALGAAVILCREIATRARDLCLAADRMATRHGGD